MISPGQGEHFMSHFRIVTTYPHSIEKVWAALTDPELIPLWTVTGQGAHAEEFAPNVGTHFRYIGKPVPGWDGVVHCEVLAADAPRFLKYSWANHPDDEASIVAYELTSTLESATTLVYEHTGFKGVGGILMSKLLARVRRKMLTKGLPPVLDDLTDAGTLRTDSLLRPKQS
jgi:uncharacterized protein YndB with AHSA1/START domain